MGVPRGFALLKGCCPSSILVYRAQNFVGTFPIVYGHRGRDAVGLFRDADKDIPIWAIFEVMMLGNFWRSLRMPRSSREDRYRSRLGDACEP